MCNAIDVRSGAVMTMSGTWLDAVILSVEGATLLATDGSLGRTEVGTRLVIGSGGRSSRTRGRTTRTPTTSATRAPLSPTMVATAMGSAMPATP